MSFNQIKGQDKPIDILRGYIKSSTAAGAWLFAGPDGIGKSLAAREFAKTINCLSKDDDSCDTCLSCIKIDKNQHPDIHFIPTLQNRPDGTVGADGIGRDSAPKGQEKREPGLYPGWAPFSPLHFQSWRRESNP